MRSSRIRRWGALTLLYFGACLWDGPARQMSQYDHEIEASTQAIDAAKDDAERAKGRAARGHACSEKARYGRTLKRLSLDECRDLFERAANDLDAAIALSPDDAELYLSRGHSYFDHAGLEDPADPRTRPLLDAAAASFTKAIEKKDGNAPALDLRGLVYLQVGDYERAIADFTREMELDPKLGRLRLAETHCQRGSVHQRARERDPAITDYERSIAFGAPSDGCECQPHSPLARLYFEKGEYDKSWKIVHDAQRSSQWIEPELLEELQKASAKARPAGAPAASAPTS